MDPTVLQQTPLQPSPGIGDGSKSERTPLALRVFGALLMAGALFVEGDGSVRKAVRSAARVDVVVIVAEAVAAEDGSLPEDAATDGIHLRKEACQTWLTYLREHTAAGPAPEGEKGAV